MAVVKIGTARFENETMAAEAVQMDGELRDVWIDAWTAPETGYIGPMYDAIVRELRIYGGVPVTLKWCFMADEVEGKDPEDYPWDNGTMAIEVDGDAVVRQFTVEQSNGNSGTIRGFDSAEDAVSAAEHDWEHMSEGDRRRYSDRSKGACFIVTDPADREIRDFAEEYRRATERARFGGESADHLNRGVIQRQRNLRGDEWVDGAWALSDSWNGSESVSDILREGFADDPEEAMDLLDTLAAINVIVAEGE